MVGAQLIAGSAIGGPWLALFALMIYVTTPGQPTGVEGVLSKTVQPSSSSYFVIAAKLLRPRMQSVQNISALPQGNYSVANHFLFGARSGVVGFLPPVGIATPHRGLLHYRGTSGVSQIRMSEKRYKEQLMGKKFRTVGRSSVARHYRIQGRGGGLPRIGKATGLPSKPIVLPMRRCMLLGKMDNRKAMAVSHSGHRTHRIQHVNLAWKRLWWPEGNCYVRLRLSMKGLKTIKKYGLQRAADKFKLNLKDKHLFAGRSHRGKVRREADKPKAPDDSTCVSTATADALAVRCSVTNM